MTYKNNTCLCGAEGDGDSWANYGKPNYTNLKEEFCPGCGEYGYTKQVGCYACDYNEKEAA